MIAGRPICLEHRLGLLDVRHVHRARRAQADLLHGLAESRAVLGHQDRRQLRADQPDAEPLEHPVLGQRDRDVQRRLAARASGSTRVGPLELEDTRDGVGGDRLDVGARRELRVGHDRGGVRVHQHHLDAFLAQRLAGLRARVVELAALADHDRAGADQEHLVQRRVLRHGGLHERAEAAEQVGGVVRTRRRLGVVLHGEQRQLAVAQALDRVVVQVHVRDLDVLGLGERGGVDGEAVVLRRDHDAPGLLVALGLVRAVVPEAQLARRAAEREAEDLVAEADAEQRHASPDQLAHDRDRVGHRGRIARAVGQEHAVGLEREHVLAPASRRARPSRRSPRSRARAGCCA